MLHLVAPAGRENFLAHLAVVNVVHNLLCVKVSELDGEGLEGLAIWDVAS